MASQQPVPERPCGLEQFEDLASVALMEVANRQTSMTCSGSLMRIVFCAYTSEAAKDG